MNGLPPPPDAVYDVNGLPLPPDADMCKDAQLEKEEELKKALSGCDHDHLSTVYKDINSLSVLVSRQTLM